MTDSPSCPPRPAALFVDGDNLPASMAPAILEAAAAIGRLDMRRVYAAEGAAKGWATVPGVCLHVVAGTKNGTDLALCIDAVAAACEGGISAFALASDDRDFTHLACWLRERGCHVLGIGTAKSPDGWRGACAGFALLGSEPRVTATPSLSGLDRHLRKAIGRSPSGKPVMILGSLLAAAGLRPPDGGRWRDYMATRPDLYDLEPRGPGASVRWIGG